MNGPDRYVLVAGRSRCWLDAHIGQEYQVSPEHVAVWGKPEGDVIAAGTFEACRAAGLLLLEER